MHQRLVGPTATLSCAALLIASGCPESPNEEPVVSGDPGDLTAQLPSIERAPECADLDSGEELASVSPEGFAWLTRPADDAGFTRVRVIDPGDLANASTQQVAFAEVSSLHARTAQDANVLADGALWRLEGFARTRMEAPEVELAGASLCGSMDSGGHIVSGAGLYELRDDAWWSWTSGTLDMSAPRFVDRQGACAGPDGAIWLTGADGTLWSVQDGALTRIAQVPGVLDVSAAATRVFALDPEWVSARGADGEWSSWSVDGLDAFALGSSTDTTWMAARQGLYRWRADGWSVLALSEDQAPATLHAHEGGVWWSTATQVCHLSDGVGVQVDGALPFGRTRDDSVSFELRTADGEAPEVSLAGEPIATTAAEDAWTVEVPLANLGWHAVDLTTAAGTRTLHLERVPRADLSWQTEIAPLFEAHCSDCHNGADALSIDLSTHGRWVEQADRLREVVVDSETMPPAASRKDAWGQDTVDTIDQWLSGAMNP